MKTVFYAVVVSLIFVGCKTKNDTVRPRTSKPDEACPLDEVTWTNVEVGFDKKETLKVLNVIEAALKGNMAQLKGQASFKLNIDFKKMIQEVKRQGFKISQAATELAVKVRRTGCLVWRKVISKKKGEEILTQLLLNTRTQKKSISK